jgi:hypothetical protein
VGSVSINPNGALQMDSKEQCCQTDFTQQPPVTSCFYS